MVTTTMVIVVEFYHIEDTILNVLILVFTNFNGDQQIGPLKLILKKGQGFTVYHYSW